MKAVQGRCQIYLDGGVRTGTDVLKAIALGANAVFVGRPVIWGLNYNGREGVEQVIQILKDELEMALRLSGCDDVRKLDKSYLTTKTEYIRKLQEFLDEN